MFYAFWIPLIPTIFWIVYFYRRDDKDKEPKKLVFYSILLGFVAAFFIAIIESIALSLSGLSMFVLSTSLVGFGAMLLVGLVEELSKFILLRFSFYRSKYFNEISDGIIYAVGIGLGFAFIENILYSMRLGLNTSIVRSLVTPLFHAAAGALSGYFLALGRFHGKELVKYAGIPIAALIHGVSNYLLIAAALTGSYTPVVLAVLMDLSLIIWLFVIYKRSNRAFPAEKCHVRTIPAVAVFLNFIPGFGLIYLRKWIVGILIMASIVFFYALSSYAFLNQLPEWPTVNIVSLSSILFIWLVSTIFVYFLSFKTRKDLLCD